MSAAARSCMSCAHRRGTDMHSVFSPAQCTRTGFPCATEINPRFERISVCGPQLQAWAPRPSPLLRLWRWAAGYPK